MLRKTITVAAVLCMLLPSVAFADLHYGSVVHPIIDREVSMGWIPWGGSTVETDNLAPAGADTVLFVFNKQNNQWVLAGWDDDSGAGYASKVTGIGGTQLRIIVIAFSPSFAGTCNVKVNGAVVASGPFGGEIVHRQDDSWDVGDVFTIIGDHTETPHYPLQDSLLYILPYEVGGKLQSDDDSSLNRQATVTATEANDGQWSTHSLVVAPYPNTGDGAFLLHQRRVNYTDADGDGINSFDETELGTSDTDTDSDGDGLPDYQELVGVPDPAGTAGAYDASLELRAYYYATPDAPDVFIQYDYYQYSPPNALQSDWLVSMFTNDTAYSGKTVYVHYETVHAFAAVRYLGEYDCQ